MKSSLLMMIMALVILFGFIIGLCAGIEVGERKAFEANDWWAKVFCYQEKGDLKEVFLGKDICTIDGKEYVAKLKLETELPPNISSAKKWQLVLK